MASPDVLWILSSWLYLPLLRNVLPHLSPWFAQNSNRSGTDVCPIFMAFFTAVMFPGGKKAELKNSRLNDQTNVERLAAYNVTLASSWCLSYKPPSMPPKVRERLPCESPTLPLPQYRKNIK